MRVALGALLVCVACSRSADTPRATEDRGSAVAAGDAAATASLDARVLTALAKRTDRPVAGSQIRAGAHTLELTTTIEADQATPEGRAVALAVDVVLDDIRAGKLGTGAVGVGRDREAALATAIDEWVAQFGAPIVSAFEGAAPSFEAVGMKIYASPVGIRGTPPATTDLAASAFAALAPALRVIVAQDDGFHALTVNVSHAPDRIDAEVRFDGERHSVLTMDAKRATWPDGDYMLKLFYVLIR